MSTQKTIVFNTCKQETGNPGANLKKFVKKYKETYKIGLNKDSIDLQKIKRTNLFVIAAPKASFAKEEIQALQQLIESGGNLLIFGQEGGQRKNDTNINAITKKYGITMNNDCVIRTSFYKYFHPKQAYIHNGILNQEVTRVINGYSKQPKGKFNNMFMLGGRDDEEQEYQRQAKRVGADFVYSYGATLNIVNPAYPILTSGPLTYPSNRPIAGVHITKNGGKLMVCGSISMFTDDYFQSQQNQKIMDFILKFYLTDEVDFQFNKEDNESNEYNFVPDISEIADNLKSCFHQGEDIPKDFGTMFEISLFKYDFDLVPEVISMFTKMDVKHEPLTLIVPQFQTPLLGLAPGVFAPCLREPPNPPLQLFDLDDEFSSQKVRLAQLTNKCQNGDIEYFVRQAGDILGISDKIKNRVQPKAIVKYVLQQIIKFKKNNLA